MVDSFLMSASVFFLFSNDLFCVTWLHLGVESMRKPMQRENRSKTLTKLGDSIYCKTKTMYVCMYVCMYILCNFNWNEEGSFFEYGIQLSQFFCGFFSFQ